MFLERHSQWAVHNLQISADGLSVSGRNGQEGGLYIYIFHFVEEAIGTEYILYHFKLKHG